MAADIQYIDENPPENWLLVTGSTGGQISLPYGLMVDFKGRERGRDIFVVLEGVNKGKQVSVKQKGPSTSYLTKDIKHMPAGQVSFDSKSQTLRFGGMGPYNAFSGGGVQGFTPVPPGIYDLAIPAYPSAQTRLQYAKWTAFHRTWFRIGTDTSGSRFLHAGEISDGCVTVRQFLYDGKAGSFLPDGFNDLASTVSTPSQGLIGLPLPASPAPVISFTDIYRYLILRRLNDQSVGRVVVTNDGRR